MPVIPRQLIGELSQALQSRISTASVALLGPATEPVQATTTQNPLLPSIPIVPGLTSAVLNTPTQIAVTSSIQVVSTTSVTPVATTSAAPTTTSAPSTTLVVTSSSEILSTSTPVTSAVLSLTTPAVSETPDVITSTSAVVVTRSSASATATGVPANAGSSTQDNNMSGGIIALIVVGALLAVLLAGAFTFRRVQVYRRAKRRANDYGAAIPDNAPFPFTNVSESDLKGAQSIRDPVANYNEKPLPSIVPDAYPAPPNPTYNQYGQYGDDGMSGPYPAMGGAAMGYGYGYGQPGRASPAPSQVQAARMASPSPPPAAYAPGPGVYPNPFPQAPTPAPAPTPALSIPAASSLAVPQVGAKKRVIQTFQPTLPDELDIREGDWVTVVHAYDDGWGLCECSGRRGVVPLECLDPGKPDFRASRRFSSLSAIRQ